MFCYGHFCAKLICFSYPLDKKRKKEGAAVFS